MSALSPSAPSQPTTSQAYTTPGNPTEKTPQEQSQATFNASDNAAFADQRIPTKQATHEQGLQNAKFEEGKGVHGAPAGEESKGLSEEDVGRHKELDEQQMAMPGEGRVADAVARKGVGLGGGGAQPGLESDLDRKKAEQAEAREAIKAEKAQAAAQGGALGQTGGPANPVDNATQGGGNYPNSSY
ncbi:hypothetical protein COCSADRAFT_38122 [Bipolaris sorokiniana ND90Pr]|uniref:Uncharacterized protein n=1 Tax=Cochliobolus sativus (strain ND90Pr / ATCC 201652) TaxID=665912 RepID=M2T227_COCSN|nr:uncharacterized protein COCSADRAFT_38122 [Bipolaris sorokiniana ND90Pr]EMD63256.1 hypothetical protein COCSADRAFT_38122 [Bipolaris sorokiniana ND90Pr]